jgi:hypothetical protein
MKSMYDFLAITKEDYNNIDIDILKTHTFREADLVQKKIDTKLIAKGDSSLDVKAAKLRELRRMIKGYYTAGE